MGCCISRSQGGPNSPYPDPSNTGSARAINPPRSGAAHDRDDSPAATTQPSARGRRHRHSSMAPECRINKALRRHVWGSTGRVWTRSTLDRERTAFFDTRVTGHPEVWQTLHVALQTLWASANQDPPDAGLATAQAILDAADITLPTGNLAQGAYDSSGQYYQLNEWVVADPINVVEDDATIDGADDGFSTRDIKDDLAGGQETMEELDEDENVRRKEEKGKAVEDKRKQLSVRARLSENESAVNVTFAESDSVNIIARKILCESGLPMSRLIRIIFMGKVLKENLPLTEQGWTPGNTVNAYVFDP